MSQDLEFKRFNKLYFDNFLNTYYVYEEFSAEDYLADWEEQDGGWVKSGTEIKEYCYILPFSENDCLKIYSSIDRFGPNAGLARPLGEDAIRLVLADRLTLKPLRPGFTRVNRSGALERKMNDRILFIISSLGYPEVCSICKSPMRVEPNRTSRVNFLRCSNYVQCGAKGISIRVPR